MLAFILQRLIQAVIVMVTVAFIAFLLFQYVGDPVVFLLGQDATKEQIDLLRADLGLDQPFFVQFGHFLVNAVQGEFGLSLRQGAKVSRLIAERLPATLELAMVAAGLKPEFIHYPLTERQRPVTRRLIQDYLREHGKPEAIFCHSDDVALGIYRGLCDAGVSVPEEIALVGCDGIEDTEYLECPLTTLVQPVAEMCAQAWLLLQQRLEDASKPAQHVMLKPALAIRESSRRRN